MTTGVIVGPPTPKRAGDTLAATTTALDTVLLVQDAGDFAEDFSVPRYLVIGDETTPRQYIAVENDEASQQSVTLAVAIGGVYEAGLPVTLWDADSEASDKRAVEYQAWVQTDETDKPVPVTIRHNMIPLAGAFTLEGAHVEIDETEPGSRDWYVANVIGRESVVADTEIIGGVFRTGPVGGGRAELTDYGGGDAQLSLFDSDGNIVGRLSVDGTGEHLELSTGFGLPNAALTVIQNVGTATSGSHSATEGLIDSSRAGGGLTGASINNSGRIVRTTSTARHKRAVEPLSLEQARTALTLEPVSFLWNEDRDMGGRRQPGFIAEQAHAVGANLWVTYADDDESGQPEGFRYAELTAALVKIAQDQDARIAALEAEIARLTGD